MDKIQISAKPGEGFSIRLPANPSTGYAWNVSAQPEGIRFLDSDFVPVKGEQPIVGAAGEQIFRFLAEQPGEYLIEMELKRAWEQQSIQNQQVKVVVLR